MHHCVLYFVDSLFSDSSTSRILCSPSCPVPCTVITCSKPVPDIRRPKITCRAFFPSIEPIRAVRFTPMTSTPQNCHYQEANLTHRPIFQGGLCFIGVEKMVPFHPLPGPSIICRPTPVRPSDNPGMTVYSAP